MLYPCYKATVVLSLIVVIGGLSACSGSSPAKQSSLWEQRRNSQNVETPAAAEYQQELAAIDQSTSDVEQSYQDEQSNVVLDEPVESEAVVVAEETQAGSSDAEKEIMSLPATYYTVQLLASKDIDRLYKFAEQHQLSAHYIIATARDGIVWYVLLLDVYENYSSAKASMVEVQNSLTTQPWIRSIGSVQKLMK